MSDKVKSDEMEDKLAKKGDGIKTNISELPDENESSESGGEKENMKTKTKCKKKGAANVKMKSCAKLKDQSTCRKANIIDMEMVEVRHGGDGTQSWNCFEVMGASDQGERNYVNPLREEIDIDREQLRRTHVGRMLLRLSRRERIAA